MLSSGLSATVKNKEGENAFHRIARTEVMNKSQLESTIELIKLLKEKGADINLYSDSGLTPLHVLFVKNDAMWRKMTDIHKSLLDAFISNGANVRLNLKNENKRPLIVEVARKMYGLPTLKRKDGSIPVAFESSFDMMKLLVEKGYDVNTQDSEKNTALTILIDEKKGFDENRRLEIISYLIENKANPYLKNKNRINAFGLAKDNPQLMQILKKEKVK